VTLLVFGAFLSSAGTASATDMTKIARQFPRHKGATWLWVNFDGWSNYAKTKNSIYPFNTTTGNRDRDIQEVLFRTQEMFAPFDVQVVRAFGNGRYDRRPLGNTTVFIGANSAHVRNGKKFPLAHTPGRFTDFPGQVRGDSHRPNSDPYDLAFVDPIAQEGDKWKNTRDNLGIASGVAHEAGHTFGLAHTLSAPIKEMMSYDAPNRFFANRTLRISDRNQTPTGVVNTPLVLPRWRGTQIVTQNSFTYLWSVLGPRRVDAHANVADTAAVDPAYRDGRLVELVPGTSVRASIERRGDYDVFRLKQADRQSLIVWVSPAAGSKLAPVLLVYDGVGRRLVAFDNGRARSGRVARVLLPAGAARNYKVVVGGADGSTAGAYTLSAAVRGAAQPLR
jgi:hypothetical protein